MDSRDENRATRSMSPDGGGADDPTLPPLDSPNPSGPPSRFPVDHWDRYRIEAYIGGGGMGSVYKAFDPNLGRHVALKFMQGDHPSLVRRFEQEARAQARVDHDRVCKVYEVGEVQGRPYIAMQFIDGAPLDRAAREMTLEQKLLAMRDVAHGLHAAHRTGLIHRDVKPANILVEQTGDGRFRPSVVDFGLARAGESAGVTQTGAVMGTPYYMSPEQASGQIDRVDRRSDVYGLGATLYEILTGRPPFEGDTPTVVLVKVLQDVPDPLQKKGAAIPADVEAIAMRCLRKDPEERYPSARALADDLQRYLDGEPVHARPSGLLYRLRMKAAKHRVAVTVGGVAAGLLAVSLAWGAYQGWNAARRARLSQSFGQQVERIEALARYSHTVPLHDVRPERELISERMRWIEDRMRESGSIAAGPGRYALGRGYMALEDHESAKENLEKAWEAGYREPEAAYALGRVLGQLYLEALREADQLPDPAQREARKAQVAAALRDPALEFLRQGRESAAESAEYGEALLAFYEERYDEAIAKAREAFEGRAWMYEARRLEGDVHAARASESVNRGDYEKALASFRSAEDSYREAARIGESDPGVYAALCALGRSMMRMELNDRGSDVTPYFDAGAAACDAALRADPDHTDSLSLKASLNNRMAVYRRSLGEDPAENLRVAVDSASRAIEIRPDHAKAHASLGASHLELANVAMDRGSDPLENLDRAAAAYRRSLEFEPDNPGLLNDIGLVYKARANHLANRGQDPGESYRQAIVAYRRSLEIHPDQVAANTNLGVVLFKHAESTDDPLETYGEAIAAFRRALDINPSQMVVFYQLGRAHDGEAEHLRRSGKDPRESLRKAGDAYRRAIEINPESAYRAHFYNGLARTFHQAAEYEREIGGDPSDVFARALEAYELALDANPNLFFAHDNLGALLTLRARDLLDRGEDPREALEAAARSCRRATEIKPDFFYAHADLVDVYRVQAVYEVGRGRDPEASIREGENAFRRAVEINPNASDLYLAAAEIHHSAAVWAERTGRDPGRAVADGLGLVDEYLERAPDSAEGVALRGALLLMMAQAPRDPADRAALLREADRAFEQAVNADSTLAARFESQMNRTKGLLAVLR